MKTKPCERYTFFNNKKKQISHIVWYAATGHWPMWPEIIHHLDENPFNNELSNLQLMSTSEHNVLHRSGEDHYLYGKTHSDKTKAKMSGDRMGKNNPHWKGDNASSHAKYMRAWKQKRRC